MKWELSFGKSPLEDKIFELRRLNGDLTRVSRQIKRSQAWDGQQGSNTLIRKTNRELARFQAIRTASQKLHKDLAQMMSYSAHTEHCTNTCLDGEADALRDVERYRTWFIKGLTYVPCSQGPVSLAVESTISSNDPSSSSIETIWPSATSLGGLVDDSRRKADSEDDEKVTRKPKAENVKSKLEGDALDSSW